MWYEFVQGRCTNSKSQAEWSWGKHNIMVVIATGYKENKSCHDSKKGAMAKIFGSESAMKWILNYLPYSR